MPLIPAAENQHICRCVGSHAQHEQQTNVNPVLQSLFDSKSHIYMREIWAGLQQHKVPWHTSTNYTGDMNIENNAQRTPFLKLICHSYKSNLYPLKSLERCYKALERVYVEHGIFLPILINNNFPVFGKISCREFMLRLCGKEYRIPGNIKLKGEFKNISVILKPSIKEANASPPQSFFSFMKQVNINSEFSFSASTLVKPN